MLRFGSTCAKRFIRTTRGSATPPILDIESQLHKYSPQQRKEILDHLYSPASPQKQQTSRPILNGNKVNDQDFLLGVIEQALELNILDNQLWGTVRALSKLAIKNRSDKYIGLFVELFERAKLIEDVNKRTKLLFILGRYIYRFKKVRMDPINEVEFLDTLVAHNRPFSALSLWKSREGREDVLELNDYWMEVGCLYYLEAGLLRQSQKLAIDNNVKSLKVAVNLIDVWSRQLSRNKDVTECCKWLEYWTGVIKTQTNLDYNLLKQAIRALIVARQWSFANELLELVPDKLISKSEIVVAFKFSARSKCPDSDILSFYQTISQKCPELATDPTVSGCLALSLANCNDYDSSIAVLDELTSRGLVVPFDLRTEIVKRFYRESTELGQTVKMMLFKDTEA